MNKIDIERLLSGRVTTQSASGQWVLRKHCGCGRRFWTSEGYRGHYALAHILEARKPVTRRCPGCDVRPDEPHDAGCHGGDLYERPQVRPASGASTDPSESSTPTSEAP